MQAHKHSQNRKLAPPSWSLASRGVRLQFEVAVVLISVLPLLSVFYGMYHGFFEEEAPWFLSAALIGFVSALVILGYVLLMRYPRTIIRTRRYIEEAASGDMPEVIRLMQTEKDIRSLESCLNKLVQQMRDRILTIENQKHALQEAERQRIMMESIATVCHQIGQPVTTVQISLDILKEEPLSPSARETLDTCIEQSERVKDMLAQLQKLSEYEIEPYLTSLNDGKSLIRFESLSP